MEIERKPDARRQPKEENLLLSLLLGEYAPSDTPKRPARTPVEKLLQISDAMFLTNLAMIPARLTKIGAQRALKAVERDPEKSFELLRNLFREYGDALVMSISNLIGRNKTTAAAVEIRKMSEPGLFFSHEYQRLLTHVGERNIPSRLEGFVARFADICEGAADYREVSAAINSIRSNGNVHAYMAGLGDSRTQQLRAALEDGISLVKHNLGLTHLPDKTLTEIRNLVVGDTLLDAGAGSGLLGRVLENRGLRVFSIDSRVQDFVAEKSFRKIENIDLSNAEQLITGSGIRTVLLASPTPGGTAPFVALGQLERGIVERVIIIPREFLLNSRVSRNLAAKADSYSPQNIFGFWDRLFGLKNSVSVDFVVSHQSELHPIDPMIYPILVITRK